MDLLLSVYKSKCTSSHELDLMWRRQPIWHGFYIQTRIIIASTLGQLSGFPKVLACMKCKLWGFGKKQMGILLMCVHTYTNTQNRHTSGIATGILAREAHTTYCECNDSTQHHTRQQKGKRMRKKMPVQDKTESNEWETSRRDQQREWEDATSRA